MWTWTALCQDTKLVPSWLVGGRDARWARFFMEDLALRLRGRVQLTSDGHKAYLEVVRNVFGADGIDYAMLVKLYGAAYLNENGEHRYSPSACIGFEKTPVFGDPTWEDICTSHVERQNLTMRMNMRRFTRLTNALSKKVENLRYAVALHFMHYNFARRHMTLGTSPAYAAGKADHVWTLREIAELPERYGEETLLAAA
ncbi:MAG TPA: hypothetical protein VFQ39_20115 [Longimicrobium sp.]|nr:hypothetical protein [Longimicrobium sp.]